MLIQDLLNISEAMAKNPGDEGMRQRAIKDILRKLNNGVITKKSADKQLKDKGHPGVDLVEAFPMPRGEEGKKEHKKKLDAMSPKELLAHVMKHASEEKDDGPVTAADIKNHARRLAKRLGHDNAEHYADKIKDHVTEAVSEKASAEMTRIRAEMKKVSSEIDSIIADGGQVSTTDPLNVKLSKLRKDLVKLRRSVNEEFLEEAKMPSKASMMRVAMAIAKKHKVDFDDKDGAVVKAAIVECYAQGYEDGIISVEGGEV